MAEEDRQQQIILELKKELDDARPDVLSQHFFAILSPLFVILKEDEKAFAAIYEGYSYFPNGIRTNALLGWYLGDINKDFRGAEKYERKALEIVKESEKKIGEYYSLRDVLRSKEAPLSLHLKGEIKNHQEQWKTKLSNWLHDFRLALVNNLAYHIAFGRIVELEDDAREYAKAAYDEDPKNPYYIETLAFVKLAFAFTLKGGKDDEIKETITLFDRAIYFAREKNQRLVAEVAGSHRRQAIEALRLR